jgi:hypothetical protein
VRIEKRLSSVAVALLYILYTNVVSSIALPSRPFSGV